MIDTELWEAVNGALAILGTFIIVMVMIYLIRNWQRTYREPIRFITLAFAAIILGHTIKDSASYLVRCCGVITPDGVIIGALVIVALGKIGCIKIWSDPKWGHWPWITAVALVGVFLTIQAIT